MNDEVCFKNYSYNNKAYLTCKSQQNEMYYKCDFFSKRRKKAFSISMRVKSALDPPTNQNVFFQFFYNFFSPFALQCQSESSKSEFRQSCHSTLLTYEMFLIGIRCRISHRQRQFQTIKILVPHFGCRVTNMYSNSENSNSMILYLDRLYQYYI